ncbi:UNVERIFIED_CONTAM: Retrovirus-related Pol polyprotein from transposon RE1 [Sesamum radiatum]|uniref:Retrovirus-related Pol polyprotein from transposon RE1 n=1 Tax=Sesamum radiatum TaxID=300843 RepID=A0AAW2QG13_SESRA
MHEFEMSDLGTILGIEMVNTCDGIFISQKKYIGEILDRFLMKDCDAVSTPIELNLKLNKDYEGKKVDSTLYKQIVASLMYLTATRPNIMYSMSLISRYMENPIEMHLLVAKRILCYLQGTRDYGIFYRNGEKPTLLGFTDSIYAGDQDDRRSPSGYVFMLGTAAISWSSEKQRIFTLSSKEAEFIVTTTCACQAIWFRKILEELKFKQSKATTVFCDNNSAIKLSRNSVLHGRSKHIDVKFYFLRDLTNGGVINLKFCRSDEQLVDILTKPLKPSVFQHLRRSIGVCTQEDPV